MPWSKDKGGYTTKRGGWIKNPKLYEQLKQKMSKTKAAKIANSKSKN